MRDLHARKLWLQPVDCMLHTSLLTHRVAQYDQRSFQTHLQAIPYSFHRLPFPAFSTQDQIRFGLLDHSNLSFTIMIAKGEVDSLTFHIHITYHTHRRDHEPVLT